MRFDAVLNQFDLQHFTPDSAPKTFLHGRSVSRKYLGLTPSGRAALEAGARLKALSSARKMLFIKRQIRPSRLRTVNVGCAGVDFDQVKLAIISSFCIVYLSICAAAKPR